MGRAARRRRLDGPLPRRAGGERRRPDRLRDRLPPRFPARPAARPPRRRARPRDGRPLARARARLDGAGPDGRPAHARRRGRRGPVRLSRRRHPRRRPLRGPRLPSPMSYTLRGRLETRLAALVLPLAAAALLALTLRTWWPVELAGVMAGVLLALDLVYDRAIPYQPGWVALPLGCLELGLVTAAVTALGLHVPLLAALGLFGAGWLAAQLLGHALLPLWRLSYAEDGGELGRAGPVLGLGVAVLFAAAGGVWRASLPPTVHLGARVYPGPLVVDRREGIVVRHSDVAISRVHVRGGQNGIDVEGVDGVVLKHVTVSGATLDGIHVRRAAIRIEDCSVEVSAPYAQGIDISFNA